MMKKLISLVCCLLPMGVRAEPQMIAPNGADSAVATTYDTWQSAITNGQSIVITGGNGINATGGQTDGGLTVAPGLAVGNNMIVGLELNPGTNDATPDGTVSNLYVLGSAQNPFTVISTGDVSIGSMLQVLNGVSLGFKTNDSAPVEFNVEVGSDGIKVGDAGAVASLSMDDVDNLTVGGSVIAYGDFSVNANSVDIAGGINAYGGTININSVGAVSFAGLTADDSVVATNVSGTAIVSDGDVSNQGGDMNLTGTNSIDITGNLENSSANSMTVSGGDLSVSGTVKNDNMDGSLTVNVDNWTVEGGDKNGFSLVNSGDFSATVKGTTTIKNGMNLDAMGNDNLFSLDTGQLVIDTNAFSAFSNALNMFNLAIRDGDIDVSRILNGDGNASASMSLLAENVNVATVQNQGDKLVVKAADLDSGYDVIAPAATDAVGNINVSGQVIGVADSTTEIIASGVLTVDGAVSNAGKMTLNGNEVGVASLSNTGAGANLTVSSLTAASGTVNVSGDITNTQGTTTVWAKNVDIVGTITNNSGTTTIRGSDANGGAVSIGALNASGGIVNLDALAGAVEIQNALTVNGATLNLGSSLHNLSVGNSVQIAGSLNAGASDVAVAGDVNVATSGTTPFVMQADAILIDGDINVVDAAVVRNIQLNAPVINVSGNATVENKGYLTLGTEATSYVRVAGDLNVDVGATFETYANDLVVGTLTGDSKFIVHGENITAEVGDIDIAGNVYFDVNNDPVAPTAGLIVRDTTSLTLKTIASGADIKVGAVSVGNGNTLAFNSADMVSLAGAVINNGTLDVDAVGALDITGVLTNVGDFTTTASDVELAGINNTGNAEITSSTGAIDTGDITTSGSLVVNSATGIIAGVVSQTGGVMDFGGDSLSAQNLIVSGNIGTQANINVATVEIDGNVNVAGDFVQGGTGGMLNLRATDFGANSLTIGGNFIAQSGNTAYDIVGNVAISGDIEVANGTFASVQAGRGIVATNLVNMGNLDLSALLDVELGNITNSGALNIRGAGGVAGADVVNNDGTLLVDSGTGVFDLGALNVNGGYMTVRGRGMNATGDISSVGGLYQNYVGGLRDGDINVIADDYTISTSGLYVANINQDGKMRINTSDVIVGGDIIANNLQFVAQLGDNWSDNNPQLPWLQVAVGGNVSGGVGFVGLGKMDISGNYIFDQGSMLNAAILPYATGAGTSDINYWATVSLADDDTLGDITNAADGRALIEVGGKFTSGVEYDYKGFELDAGKTALGQGQIGIDLFHVVDQGTAIWLVHSEEGVENFSLLEQMRNLDVKFCNADGSICTNYLDSLTVKDETDLNGTDGDLPVYISVRDTDNNGVADSLYVVFDPRFGGPVLLENLKIQPIVARVPEHTDGEYVSAGALDNMLIGQAHNKKFLNGAPLEIVPIIFEGTNLSTMANELYNRMEHYVETSEGGALARFSRLFQVREIEQIAGAIALNEHTSFRSFEDRMFDEFIWNRNRNLKKAWMDVDYGMFYQNIDDGKHTDGHRFSVAGGFDWQESNTLQLGLTGRVSHTTSKAGDAMDLSYAATTQSGSVSIEVADTNVGLGGYLMKILGEKTRVYGNAFLDLHVFDVDRNQTFVDRIDGDGTAFSIMSEWGLMHDILNQYVVGNAYARVGYDFGFNVKEKVAGDDYMRLESDGYFALTPGYSLIAQKRIYPSAWFQIRPYVSIGVEYDVFGAPDFAEYKFVVAEEFTKYDIDIDPLWANVGGGIELLSARGLQFGIDYRYQYNDAIQLHNIKVSGSYRF